MKISYSVIAIVLLIAVALAVSGCSGGSSTTNPTPTPQASGTATPGASQPGQLFNMGSLNMYEYKLTSTTSGQKTEMTYKIEYNDDTYQGAPAKLTKMTWNMPGTGDMVAYLYYSKTDDHLLGGKYTMNAGGQNIEIPIEASQGDTYSQNDWAATSYEDFNDMSGWTSAGTETLQANGKSYSCAKHTWSLGTVSYSVCTNTQAPMPMKYEWSDSKGDSWKMELLNWN